MASPTNVLLSGTSSPFNLLPQLTTSSSPLGVTQSNSLGGFYTGTASPNNMSSLPLYLGGSSSTSPLNSMLSSNNSFLNSSQNWLNQYEASNALPLTVPLTNGQLSTTLRTPQSPVQPIGTFAQGLNSLVPDINSGTALLSAMANLKNTITRSTPYSTLAVTPKSAVAGAASLPYTVGKPLVATPSQPASMTPILIIGGIVIAAVIFAAMI